MVQELIDNLLNANLYPHPVGAFQVIETHLSWVILTGSFAYKIKKPLNLGFNDYTTLEKRQHYCELELKLNQRLAPQIYLEVITIYGTATDPSLSHGKVLEYALKMKEFEQSELLSKIAKSRSLSATTIRQLAADIAHFHTQSEISAPSSPYGSEAAVIEPALDNFRQLNEAKDPVILDAIKSIAAWNHQVFKQSALFIKSRKQQGYIRACHGDLHLGNIVLIHDKPVIFDCIEFNESFRWIDVMNDIAFLAMDLEHFKLHDLSSLLINEYVTHTYDYEGLALLRFYQCYRAVVRAKINYLQSLQASQNSAALLQECHHFLDLAQQYSTDITPSITLTYGLSGSGKSLYTSTLLKDTRTIRIRSDAIRQRLYKETDSKSERYSPEASVRTYLEMVRLTKILVIAGFHVIVDATFLRRVDRELFITLADEMKVSIHILSFITSEITLRRRVAQRELKRNDISEADESVLNLQQKAVESLTAREEAIAQHIDEDVIEKLIPR